VNYFCPLGTVFPHIVGGGNYSVGGGVNNRTRHSQARCAPGSYCLNSITILCPPGRYGSTYGLADATCTGEFSLHTCVSVFLLFSGNIQLGVPRDTTVHLAARYPLSVPPHNIRQALWRYAVSVRVGDSLLYPVKMRKGVVSGHNT
jgi:hypothetical protein